ncbi:MAG: hypothetical protein WC882_00160 [Candidatus Gracilibacteria bacterium]
MKKIPLNFISLGLLLVSVLVLHGVHNVRAQTDADIQEACDGFKYNGTQLMEDLFEDAAGSADLDVVNIFKNMFGQSKTPKVEDLYLSIYKKVRAEPEDTAVRATAEDYQFTQEQMCAVLGGSFAPIASMNENEVVPITEAMDILAEMQETYRDHLAEAQMAQEMLMDSYMREIFANGDTGDSGFDVLYDMEIIEYLLFGEAGYETSSSEGDETDETANDDGSDEETPSESPESTSDDGTDASTEESPAESTTSTTEQEKDEAVAPSSCDADPGLQSAFAAVVPEPSEEEPASDSSDPSTDTPDTSGDGTPEDVAETTPDVILPAPANDWTSPEVCDSVFCLFINFVNRPDSSYTKADNCIQCHVQYIVEALEETLSQSLTLGKVSGNIMEPPVCKNDLLLSLTQIDLNLFLIPMPIQTPPANDIVTGLGFCDGIKDFMGDKDPYKLSIQNLFDGDKGTGGVCGVDPDTLVDKKLTEEELAKLRSYGNGIENAMKDATTRSENGTSVNELLTQALNDYDAHMDEFEKTFEDSYTVTRSGAQNTLYQSLGDEMDQMTNYFRAFYESISMTQAVTEKLKNNFKPVP